MTKYILFKKPEQYDTLYIVQYLYSLGTNLQPVSCIEHNHNAFNKNVEQIPTIYNIDNNTYHHGINEVINFYEKQTGIEKILQKSNEFKQQNPNYRIKK
jgi:hypothetical protein